MCPQASRTPARAAAGQNARRPPGGGGLDGLGRLRFLLLAVTVALSAAYLVVGLAPTVPQPFAGVSDVLLHGISYALLSCVAVAAAAAFGLGVRWAAVLGVVYGAAHGALLEALQHFAPPRRAEAKDLLVDLCAALIGGIPWWFVRSRR